MICILNKRNYAIRKCIDTMVCMLIADINSQMLSFSVGCLEPEIIRKFLTVRGIYIFAIGA